MSATLTFSETTVLNGAYSAGANASGRSDSIKTGSNSFPTTKLNFKYGSGNVLLNSALQVNDWYVDKLNIGAGVTTSIDLFGSSYLNPFGANLAFTSIRGVFIALSGADGAKSVQVGPQAVANAAQLWFGGVGATVYSTVYWHQFWLGPIAGWAITPTTADLLPIKNPGGSAVDVYVAILGVK